MQVSDPRQAQNLHVTGLGPGRVSSQPIAQPVCHLNQPGSRLTSPWLDTETQIATQVPGSAAGAPIVTKSSCLSSLHPSMHLSAACGPVHKVGQGVSTTPLKYEPQDDQDPVLLGHESDSWWEGDSSDSGSDSEDLEPKVLGPSSRKSVLPPSSGGAPALDSVQSISVLVEGEYTSHNGGSSSSSGKRGSGPSSSTRHRTGGSSGSSANAANQGSSSRHHSLGSPDDNDEEDDEEPEDEGDSGPPDAPPPSGARFLACPFYKRTPTVCREKAMNDRKWRACMGPGWVNTHRMKYMPALPTIPSWSKSC